MLKARWAHLLWQYSLCILAFAIPLPFRFGSLAIIILAAAWLLQLQPKETFNNLKSRKALWPWFIYFALHAISYTYSQNKDQSLFDLQSKLSFVLLPLLIGTGSAISSKQTERIFLFFISGVSAIALFSMGRHVFSYLQSHDFSSLFYNHLVEGLDANAVTQAWYTIFAISLLLFVHWEHFFKGFYNYLKIKLIIILTLFLILLSARMLMVLYFLFILPYFMLQSVKRLSKARIIIISTIITALAATLVFTENPVKKRYEDIFKINVNQSFLDDYTHVAEGDFSNLTLRVFLWRIGFENINEKHLWLTGAGNGDVYKLQNDKMHSYGMNIYPPVEAWRSPFYNANLHNMYIQSLMMLGIGGLFIFILISFSPFRKLTQIKYNRLFFVFNVIAIFVMMQEAALQSQGGIIYYTFFIQLFWLLYYTRNEVAIN
jgi:O-antigen ligase